MNQVIKKTNRIKVVFVIPSLEAGGAEKVMSYIAQKIDKEIFNPNLWILTSPTDKDYTIESVEYRYFNRSRVLTAFIPLFKALRKDKPNVVLSSITHLNILMGILAIFFTRTRFIGREANVLSMKSKFSKRKSLLSRVLFKVAFFYLDSVICQSKDMKKDLVENYGIPKRKLVLINNPVTNTTGPMVKVNRDKTQIINFITVASLKEQKGHIRMLKALAELDFDFQYTIIGDGQYKEKIFEKIRELALEPKIVHIPYTNEVEKYLANNHFFLQGAYTEGFPNCLLESCVAGLPVIAYSAPGGLNEIIVDGTNGYLANDDKDFIDKLNKAVSQNWDPIAIKQDIIHRFGSDKILQEYERLFQNK